MNALMITFFLKISLVNEIIYKSRINFIQYQIKHGINIRVPF